MALGAARELLTNVRMTRIGILVAVLACAPVAAAEGVVIETATDDTSASAADREHNARTLRRTLDDLITSHAISANAHVDASVVNLTVEPTGDLVIVSAQVRIAISDDSGRILSVLTGGAKVETSARPYRSRSLGRMRDEALAAAATGMFGKVKIALVPASSTSWFGKLVGDLFAITRPFPRS